MMTFPISIPELTGKEQINKQTWWVLSKGDFEHWIYETKRKYEKRMTRIQQYDNFR